MHLAYFDDSGSDKKSAIALFGAVLIKDSWFREIETACGVVLENLIPPEKLDQFEEFHAAELFHGFGVFEGISEETRFRAITSILEQVEHFNAPCVYSAVDKAALRSTALGSANPVDISFRMCALGVEAWLRDHDIANIGLFIVDDTDNKDLKRQLREGFRALRPRLLPPSWRLGRVWCVHDDMYFGSSVDSVGIQMADICNYIIARTIKGADDVAQFYDIIKKFVICSKVEPEWSQHKGVFLEAQITQ